MTRSSSQSQEQPQEQSQTRTKYDSAFQCHVLITDRFAPDALAHLKSDHRLRITQSHTPQPTADELRDIDVLLIRSRTLIHSDLLSQVERLKLIVTSTSGFDHLDLYLIQELGIEIMYTPNANAASACELTWGLVLTCARKIAAAQSAVINGEWRRDALLGVQLSGKTFGVVGLGRIGTRVIEVAQAFGMKTMAFDPYQEDAHFHRLKVRRSSLQELLQEADVVSLHVPATGETSGMISRDLLRSAKRGLLLINSSRGSVVRDQDLLEALTQNWIAGCGLDVFEHEPLSACSPLLALMPLKNIVLTPHIGATTWEAFSESSWEAARKLQEFVAYGTISDPLPPTEAWWQAKGSTLLEPRSP